LLYDEASLPIQKGLPYAARVHAHNRHFTGLGLQKGQRERLDII